MKVLDCFTGQYTLLDDEDHRAWKGFRWGQERRGYVCADFKLKGKKTQRFYLHRLIMKPGPGQQVHHKNRCVWDNRRENLECLSVEEHFERHPNSKRLAALVEARREARRLWAREQEFFALIRAAEAAGAR